MAAVSFVLGALGLLFGLFSDGEARRLFDSPDVVLVEGEVLQVFRTRHADRGALELWRFSLDGRPWYYLASGHEATERVGDLRLRVHPNAPWRPVRDDKRPMRGVEWLRWPGAFLLALVPLFLVLRRLALAARPRRFNRPAGRWMPARLVQVRKVDRRPGWFQIELESLDGQHRALSEALPFDPSPLLPEVPGMVQREQSNGGHVVDLSLLPEVRYA
ncbi:MAG: hypothetical protein ACXIUL_09120 [Wenzhouxiangella sp.]